MRRKRTRLPAFLNGMVLAAVSVTAVADPTRDVLWVALQTCVIAKKAAGRTFPCLAVDLGTDRQPGSAVLRAPGQRTHTVVMPTRPVVGLEAPDLQHADGTAYWRAARAARHYVTDALKDAVPVGAVGMAVNSVGGRSQDQLHIHLDCVRPGVRAVLRSHAGAVGDGWSLLPVDLENDRYYAMRVPAAQADDLNPFAALSRLPGRFDLRHTTVAAISVSPEDSAEGFYLLAYRAGDAHAERLLDHTCAIVSNR